MSRLHASSAVLFPILLLLTGCDALLDLGKPPVATALSVVEGGGQTAQVAEALATPLMVEVVDQRGDPMPVEGINVTWSVSDGTLASVSATTDGAGRASATWTLGTVAGEQSVTATSEDLEAVTFTATAAPGAAATLTLSADSVVVGRDPGYDTETLAAELVDTYGNGIDPVAGVVTWSSSDNTVARVDSVGRVTGVAAGVAVITAEAGAARAEARAVVRLQLNPGCVVSTGFPARPAAGGPPTYVPEHITLRAEYNIIVAIPLDVNGDGHEDVVILTSDDPNTTRETGEYRKGSAVWLNDGAGNFTDATAETVVGTLVGDFPRHYEVADFTGDGRLDIYVGQHGDESSYDLSALPGAPNLLLVPQPDGTLMDLAPTSLDIYGYSYTHGAASGDIDCDGDVDIFEANWFLGKPRIQVNHGAGTFVVEEERLPREVRSVDEPWRGWGSGVFCDIDRDGDQDLALGSAGGIEDDRRNWLLFNDGFGQFRSAPMDALPEPYFGLQGNEAVEMRCADMDLDGWNDLVISSTPVHPTYYTEPHVALVLNNHDGTFRDVTEAQLPQSWTTNFVRRVHIADLNVDGWPDIVGSGDGVGPRYFINGGDAPFTEHELPSPFVWPIPFLLVVPIDLDGDGRPDLIGPAGEGQSVVFRQE